MTYRNRIVVLTACAVLLVFAGGIGCGGGLDALEEAGNEDGRIEISQCVATTDELVELENELITLRDLVAQTDGLGECADNSVNMPDILTLPFSAGDNEMCLLNVYDADLKISMLGHAAHMIESFREIINPESTEMFDMLTTLTSGADEAVLFLDFQRVVEVDPNDETLQNEGTQLRQDTSAIVLKVRADARDQIVSYINDIISREGSKEDVVWVESDIAVLAQADAIHNIVGVISSRLANGDHQKECPIYGVDINAPRPAVYAMLNASAQFVLDSIDAPKMLGVKQILTDDTYLAIAGLDELDDVWRFQLVAFDTAAMKAASYSLFKFDAAEKLVEAFLVTIGQE